MNTFSKKRSLRLLTLSSIILLLASCGSSREYAARMSPPAPDKYTSAVDFTVDFTGGNTSFDEGTKIGHGHMCGWISGSRKDLFKQGVSQICQRRGGVWKSNLCEQGKDVLFVAYVTEKYPRICNTGLEDFNATAYEPKVGVTQEQFTSEMARLDYKSTKFIELQREMMENVLAAQRERERQRIAIQEEGARQLLLNKNREIQSKSEEMRKTIKTGTQTNCGPVIEIRGNLAKTYFPVQGYGNEHWLEVKSLFTPNAGCTFVNGRYTPPIQ
jgi:hypothetical protein